MSVEAPERIWVDVKAMTASSVAGRAPFFGVGYVRIDKLEELAAENERLRGDCRAYKKTMRAIEQADNAALAEKDKEIAALREALFVADAAIMQSHGCFPLDRSTRNEVFINEAATLIRSFTDPEFSKRKLVVDQWFARNAGGNDAE